ncbi:MAG TPA: alpha/beta fold hydrolase [Kofleriaceae bacterium]|nr:alpha/beta fold hydrolase [Kofleriaceae bacterium]
MTVVDFLDRSEEAMAAQLSDALANDTVLHMGAQLWRIGLAGIAALPPALRNLAPPPLAREALFEVLRAGWSVAARSFALYPLAQHIERTPLPAFEPTPARVVHVTSDYQLHAIEGTGEPILIVSSMINHWYVLDLDDNHSFLAMLRTLGRPIYVLDWLAAKPADDRSFGEICAGPIRSAVDHICAAHDVDALSIMGYSMGGTLATCFAARFPERIARLATLCAPIRFDNAGAFSRWLSADLVDVNLVAAAWDRVPSQLVHMPFWYLHPTVKLRKLVQLARSFEKPGYLDHFLATETWNHDNVDVPRGVFRSWIGELYQRNALLAGEVVIGGRAASLDAIRCPKLVISGASDTITPPASAEALPGARILRLDAGHVGVLTSRRALAAQAAALSTWLGERA